MMNINSHELDRQVATTALELKTLLEPTEPAMSVVIRAMDAQAVRLHLGALSALLVDAVAHGAAVNFMADFSLAEAETYWVKQINGLAAGDRIWLVAETGGQLVGTVMCVFFGQPNQPFRAEVSKMLVHSSMRRRGIGAQLMRAVEAAALGAGKSHLLLDTETGSSGDRLYRRMGWTPLGVVPRMGYAPDGRVTDATVFFKELAPPPSWRG
jgi:GNAT superfamily N-acetyltransferase